MKEFPLFVNYDTTHPIGKVQLKDEFAIVLAQFAKVGIPVKLGGCVKITNHDTQLLSLSLDFIAPTAKEFTEETTSE